MIRVFLAALAALAIITFIPSGATAADEEVASRAKSYLLKFSDGGTETYVARYRAMVDFDRWQSGSASKPLEGKFIDDRQCHWKINTTILREVCLVSRSGQAFCDGKLNRLYGTSKSGKGSDFVLIKLHPETCGEAQARYDGDLNNARNAVRSALDPVMDGDVDQMIEDFKTTLKPVEVSAQ